MNRILKTRLFVKWARKHTINDEMLLNAVAEVDKGMYEANLGGYLIKKRIATKGRGKSGSARTIIAYKRTGKMFFLYGFEKNEKENISLDEKKALKLVAGSMLNFSDDEIRERISDKSLSEVLYDEK